MTTTTTATRADRQPEGLCVIYEHGDCPGGLAYVDSPGQHLWSITGPMWSLRGDDLADHWGDAMVAIPRDLAEASTDPAVMAWAKSNINTSKEK